MSVIANSTKKELNKIFSEAARKAQDENRRKGIPNVYSRGGRIYRESLKNQPKTKSSSK